MKITQPVAILPSSIFLHVPEYVSEQRFCSEHSQYGSRAGEGQIFEGYLKQKFGGKTDTRQSQYILRFYLIPPSLARTDSKDTLTGLVVACLTAA